MPPWEDEWVRRKVRCSDGFPIVSILQFNPKEGKHMKRWINKNALSLVLIAAIIIAGLVLNAIVSHQDSQAETPELPRGIMNISGAVLYEDDEHILWKLDETIEVSFHPEDVDGEYFYWVLDDESKIRYKSWSEGSLELSRLKIESSLKIAGLDTLFRTRITATPWNSRFKFDDYGQPTNMLFEPFAQNVYVLPTWSFEDLEGGMRRYSYSDESGQTEIWVVLPEEEILALICGRKVINKQHLPIPTEVTPEKFSTFIPRAIAMYKISTGNTEEALQAMGYAITFNPESAFVTTMTDDSLWGMIIR